MMRDKQFGFYLQCKNTWVSYWIFIKHSFWHTPYYSGDCTRLHYCMKYLLYSKLLGLYSFSIILFVQKLRWWSTLQNQVTKIFAPGVNSHFELVMGPGQNFLIRVKFLLLRLCQVRSAIFGLGLENFP